MWELPVSKTLWDSTCMSDHQCNLQLVKKDFDFIETICGFFQGLIFLYEKVHKRVYTFSSSNPHYTFPLPRSKKAWIDAIKVNKK